MIEKDRKTRLLQSASYNGIDFVEVANEAQTELRVHFLNEVDLPRPLPPPVIAGGERIRTVAVRPIDDSADWLVVGGHLVLRLTTDAPGDFSNYTLTIDSPALDHAFRTTVFSFKARCPSDLDCAARPADCPEAEPDVPPIDYLAKDFLGFRQALLDFSALRYPDWQERSEADFGVMFLEALSALADDLSYTQDRVAAEATLETATQRRSVVRHARLVDYEPRPATSARVLLQFDVNRGVTEIPDGTRVSAPGPDGTPVPFETGDSLFYRLIDPLTGLRRTEPPAEPVSRAWNAGRIGPYWFDDDGQCLPRGATEMYVLGHGFAFRPGQRLLIETDAETTADAPLRQVVRLVEDLPAEELCDPLFAPPPDPPDPPPFFACTISPPAAPSPPGSPPGPAVGTAVTRIRWRPEDALTHERDLARTRLAGNIVPATQGITRAERFVIPVPAAESGFVSPVDTPGLEPGTPIGMPPGTPLALARTGPNDAPETPALQYLHTLRDAPAAWLRGHDPDERPLPEVVLTGMPPGGTEVVWRFLRRLIDAEPFEAAFTLDPARYRRIGRSLGGSTHYDYDGDDGDTVRFGDGILGEIPEPGTVFEVVYRVGAGPEGNVAPDAVSRVEPPGDGAAADPQFPRAAAVTNPLPAAGGEAAEALEHVRRIAPQDFRARQFRAVRPEDYVAAAETLPWVTRAGTVFRWTGSWHTVFTTPDPRGSERVTTGQRVELVDLLNRYRMAGYESYVPETQYVSIDLEVEVCADPDAFRGDVKEAVAEALAQFFQPDNFTFGGPLERSRLEAAVQAADGVDGVLCVHYRVRGRTAGMAEMPAVVNVGTDQIIRCDNDPSRPERGAITLTVKGGK